MASDNALKMQILLRQASRLSLRICTCSCLCDCLISCHRQKLSSISTDTSFQPHQIPYNRICISFPVLFGCFCGQQNLPIQFLYFFFFKYRPFQFFRHFIQFTAAFLCQYFRKVVASASAPTGMIVFHPSGDYAPHMVFHRPHVSVLQSFRMFRQFQTL